MQIRLLAKNSWIYFHLGGKPCRGKLDKVDLGTSPPKIYLDQIGGYNSAQRRWVKRLASSITPDGGLFYSEETDILK